MSSSDRKKSAGSKKKGKAPVRKKASKPKAAKPKKVAKGGKAVETKKKVEGEKKPPKLKVEKKVKKPAKKPKAEKTPGEPRAKPVPLHLGPAPSPTVMSRHIDSMRHRAARGFSFGELESAAVPLNVAKREGLQLDIRRRSVLDGNVELLKGWFKSPQGSKSTAAS